ncbi:MAG: hypothetical protein Q7T61_01040 [Caulobacter sp.]|nr:hypothetical protein [Caulobacter sp.]
MTKSLNAHTIDVASFAQALTMHSLAASIHDATREQKSADLVRLFSAWPKLCRAMARLEQVAPNAARIGLDQDARQQDNHQAA